MTKTKPKPLTVLIHRLFEQDRNMSYTALVAKWKKNYPNRETPNEGLFHYARKAWRKKQQSPEAIKPTPEDIKPNPLNGMLLSLESELDKLITTAGDFQDKESAEMSRKMRRLVSSRILQMEVR